MERKVQYILIEELLSIIYDHRLRADIFGPAKIGYILEPEITLLSFTEIEVVVHPEDWSTLDKLIRERFNALFRRIVPHKRYDHSISELLLHNNMYDYKYLVKDPGVLRIAIAVSGPRDYFNPRRRVFSLTRYLNRYREAPPEYSFVAKLIKPPGIFEKGDCEQFVYGFMCSREVYPWSPSRILKIVERVVSRERRYGEVIAKNVAKIRNCVEMRYICIPNERKRVRELLCFLDRMYSVLEHGESR